MEAAGRRASSSGRATGPAPTCTMPTSPMDGRQRHGAKEMQGRARPLVMPPVAPPPEVSARRVGTGQEYAPERCCREPLPRTPRERDASDPGGERDASGVDAEHGRPNQCETDAGQVMPSLAHERRHEGAQPDGRKRATARAVRSCDRMPE